MPVEGATPGWWQSAENPFEKSALPCMELTIRDHHSPREVQAEGEALSDHWAHGDLMSKKVKHAWWSAIEHKVSIFEV